MNTTSRNKTLLAIIGVLLLANIGMLVFFLRVYNPCPEREKSPGFSQRLKTEVGFSGEQAEGYEARRKEHWATLKQRLEEIKRTKIAFYEQVYDPSVPDSVIRARAGVIGEQQKQLDLQVVNYFKDIRKMCTPEQLPKYDSLMPSVIQWITERSRK